jgi:glycosyltransferase involved in cell wall biosynthesis
MSKKILFFSTGIPDPGQGGSGVFNYLLCSEILKKGFSLTAFFRVNDILLGQARENKCLKDLKDQGLEFELIKEKSLENRLLFGSSLSMALQNYEVCQQVVNQNAELIKKADGIISLDLGWAMALADCPKKALCVLDDPLQGRMEFGQPLNFLNPVSFKRWLQLKSIKSKSFFKWLKNKLGENNILGILSFYDRDMYRANGIECRVIKFFSENAPFCPRPPMEGNRIIGVHLGNLSKTASKNLLSYWMGELFPTLSALPFEIEIRFIGKFQEKLISKWDNITLNFLGHISGSLEDEFSQAHFFFSPMKYPIGIRTRIITALSYGMPVIADKASSFGLPDLKDGYDIIYASSPQEVKNALLNFKQNPEALKAIGLNARKSWEEFFNPEKNISKILNLLGLEDHNPA